MNTSLIIWKSVNYKDRNFTAYSAVLSLSSIRHRRRLMFPGISSTMKYSAPRLLPASEPI